MQKIKFAECVICNKREKFTINIKGWDFGVHINDVLRDKDGGVRGEHINCIERVRA